MPGLLSMLRGISRRRGHDERRSVPTLLPAQTIVDRWRADGSTPAAALGRTLEQVKGLCALVDDDAGWQRLTGLLIRSGGDSWLAHDWPEGFEPMMLCAPACQLVRYECARCGIGREQDGRSCANPDSAFGRVGVFLASNDRAGLSRYLGELASDLEKKLAELD